MRALRYWKVLLFYLIYTTSIVLLSGYKYILLRKHHATVLGDAQTRLGMRQYDFGEYIMTERLGQMVCLPHSIKEDHYALGVLGCISRYICTTPRCITYTKIS